ncbi:hypothetical protein V500_04570 [Pseudogymnoascus sp. VKM F-4518 (FW-2643)]|nr:hypothetical protein V500_04570 [Pseudogymnoascus sp. VKM F-4518 (FW-2643)]
MPRSSDSPPLYVAGPSAPIPLETIRKHDEEMQVPTAAPTPRPARSDPELRKFAFFFAIFVCCAIIGGCTYALAHGIQRRIANSRAAVDSAGREYWIEAARTKVYDACYLGSEGYSTPTNAYKACAKTSELKITGVTCDASVLWTSEDRYPTVCLEAMAEIYKEDMFRSARSEHLEPLGWLVLIIMAGPVGGLIAYSIFRCIVDGCRDKKASKAHNTSAA